jgi:phage tail sheath protein FI
MPRPGVDVEITEPAPSGGAILDTSQGFFVGLTERGTLGYVELHSLKEYERHFGPRTGGIAAHDAARSFFTERGSTLYQARLIGPTAETATATVGVTEAAAASPGAWGNDVTVGYEDAAAGTLAEQAQERARKPNRRARATEPEATDGPAPRATQLRAVVTYGNVVERSLPISTAGEAAAWSQTSAYVRITAVDEAAELAATPAVPLTGGIDDLAVDADVLGNALDQFGYALGPGQVSYPGCTDVALHRVIVDHCERNKRCALLDLDDADAVTLAADATALHAYSGSKFAAALAPRLIYPGPVSGTTVPVAYSAVQAGIIARADRSTGNPNEAAAGVLGQSLAARGLAVQYTDDEREQLNDLGVTLARPVYGQVRTYGSRTCAGPDEPNWRWFANSRVVMAISHDCDAVAENYVHRQIDAKRKIFTSLEQDLGGVCLRYATLEALWAFKIDTGPAVNTPDTIAAGEIHAVVGLQTSPSAEWIVIEISKTPLSQPV